MNTGQTDQRAAEQDVRGAFNMRKDRTTMIVTFVVAAFAAGVLTARPVVSQPVSARGQIPVGWWAALGSNPNWGRVYEVPTPGTYIRSTDSEESYRMVEKVSILSDGSVRLRVGEPTGF